MRNLIAPLLLALAVSGCAKARVTGFTDPDFKGRSYDSVVVFANTDSLEDAALLEDQTCRVAAGYGVSCRSLTALFPPTRSPTPDELYAFFAKEGIQAVLMLHTREDQSRDRVAFYQTFATGQAYGNYGAVQSTSVPVRSSKRQARARVELLDCESRAFAWVGDTNIEGRGRFGTTDSKFRAALAKGTVASLVKAGHFAKPAE